jgi:hypothetical protein
MASGAIGFCPAPHERMNFASRAWKAADQMRRIRLAAVISAGLALTAGGVVRDSSLLAALVALCERYWDDVGPLRVDDSGTVSMAGRPPGLV